MTAIIGPGAERLLLDLLLDFDALAEAENIDIERRRAVQSAVAYFGGWAAVFAAHSGSEGTPS